MSESTVIGVHVSGGVLRRAELVRRGERIEVVRLEAGAAPASTAPPAVSRIAPGLPTAAEPGGTSLNGARVAAALPATDVMTRCWPLPAAAGARLRQLVANRLEADLPVPMETVVWGYRQAAGGQDRAAQAMVLAQVARSERVDQFLSSLSTAGLAVHLLTTEAEGFAGLCRHALAPGFESGDVLILAGPDEWLVGAFVGGLAVSARRVRPIAGRLESACRECRQIIAAQFQKDTLRSIRWCSAAADDPAPAMLADVCALPVEPLSVSSRLTGPGGAPLTAAELVEFGPAIGLALTEMFDRDAAIRLAGAEPTAKTESRKAIESVLARPWTCATVAGAMLLAAVGIHLGSLTWELARMKNAPGSTAALAALDQLQPDIAAMNRLKTYRIDVEGICGAVVKAVKDPVTLTGLQLSREHRLTLKGKSSDPRAVFTLADDLRASGRFKDVNPERASPAQGGDFTITAELVGVEKFSTPAWGGMRGGR
ncbi:MAG: hypothetical protein AMXMBFR83_29170 [Phycisphaerae bacterium]